MHQSDLCIHELFELQVEQKPEAIVIACGDQQVTYAELNRQANRLALHLISRGIGQEAIVGLYMERSVEMLAAMLGILKAGGAYLPLDPAHPRARLAFMSQDAGLSALVTEQHFLSALPEVGTETICLEAFADSIDVQYQAPGRRANADNLAYVIYTSGSSGNPKGVQVNHHSVIHLLEATCPLLELKEDECWTAVHSFAFDFSVWEVFGALATGGRLVLVPQSVSQMPERFCELVIDEGATILSQTPSALRQFVDVVREDDAEVPSLRQIICGGEAFPKELALMLLELGVSTWNFYGPTEATVWASTQRVDSADITHRYVPIGRAISGTQMYVLDNNLEPSTEAAAELLIGGLALSRGYLNRPDLTAEKFIPDSIGQRKGARLYRTGDSARHLADGTIEFLGRIDHQIKIRGYRIELEEIESVLRQHGSVDSAAVVLSESPNGTPHLVGYVVPRIDHDLGPDELRRFLLGKLPDYMVPASLIAIDALPLTQSNKVDRMALKAVRWQDIGIRDQYVAPSSPEEELLAAVWAEVLGLERVGGDANFIRLGGDSILAARVISMTRKAFKVELGLRALFESPTLADLAAHITYLKRVKQEPTSVAIERADRSKPLPLSFAQELLWLSSQLNPSSPLSAVTFALRFEGRLNLYELERSMNEVFARHEMLRTAFKVEQGIPRQVVSPHTPVSLPLIDLSQLPKTERELRAGMLANEDAETQFDISRGSLVRATLLRMQDDNHALLVTMHNMVADGWSTMVFARDLITTYDASSSGLVSPLKQLPGQYADYAAWERLWLKPDVLKKQLAYWKMRLTPWPARIEFPFEKPNAPYSTPRGARVNVTLPEGLTSSLRTLARREGVTLFTLMIAAFKTLLFRYTGQEDIAVASPVARRNRTETEALIGLFLNTVMLRTRALGGLRFREFLRQVSEIVIDASANQDVSFYRVVEEVNRNDLGRGDPPFGIMFALRSAEAPSLERWDLKISMFEYEPTTSKANVVLSLWEAGARVEGYFEYRCGLFDESVIGRMLLHYKRTLEEIVADPDVRLIGNQIGQVAKEESNSRAGDDLEEFDFRLLDSSAL